MQQLRASRDFQPETRAAEEAYEALDPEARHSYMYGKAGANLKVLLTA